MVLPGHLISMVLVIIYGILLMMMLTLHEGCIGLDAFLDAFFPVEVSVQGMVKVCFVVEHLLACIL